MARGLAGSRVESTDVAKAGAGTKALTGASDSLVLANKDRVGLYVSNTSGANKMFLALGAAAVANSGIMIPPNTTIPVTGFMGAVNIIGTAADVAAFAEI